MNCYLLNDLPFNFGPGCQANRVATIGVLLFSDMESSYHSELGYTGAVENGKTHREGQETVSVLMTKQKREQLCL